GEGGVSLSRFTVTGRDHGSSLEGSLPRRRQEIRRLLLPTAATCWRGGASGGRRQATRSGGAGGETRPPRVGGRARDGAEFGVSSGDSRIALLCSRLA
ncbi:unnamed protein product, partial [Urochloa humidicola]